MEKIKKSYSKEYPILRMFIDDLEQIVSIFKENYKDFEIKADVYKLEDISELSKINKQEIKNFSINTYTPYISLDISESSVSLYIEDKDNLKLRGIFSKIDAILNRRISFLRILTSYWMQIPFHVIIWLNLYLFPKEYYKTIRILLVILTLALLIIWFLWRQSISLKKHSLIYLFNSQSKIGFFKRNKDKILLSIFSAVVGSILTVGLTWLIKLF